MIKVSGHKFFNAKDYIVGQCADMNCEVTGALLERNGFNFGYTSNEEDATSLFGVSYDNGWVFDEGCGSVKVIFPNETDCGVVEIYDESFDRRLTFYFVKPINLLELKMLLKSCRLNSIADNLKI